MKGMASGSLKGSPKMRASQTKKDAAWEGLLRAVARYVKSKGGYVAVAGGISSIRRPGDLSNNFTIAIRCTGMPPVEGI